VEGSGDLSTSREREAKQEREEQSAIEGMERKLLPFPESW